MKSVDFHNSAHLSAVFGGNAGGVDGKRVDIISFDFGAGTGRTIVGERDSVNHELGLILGAAGMENGVAFVEPAGLGVDEIWKRAARERCRPLGYCFGVDVVDGGDTFGIEKC